MSSVLEELNTRFPVRCTEDQKQAFRDFAQEFASSCSCPCRVEEADKQKNIVFGDPEKAKVLITAHYDTPRSAKLPNLMLPCNRRLYWARQFLIILPMLLLAIGAAAAVFAFVPLDYSKPLHRTLPLLAYLAVYFSVFLFLLRGKPNPHNANDNTSGTAAVLDTLRLCCTRGCIGDAAFVLFDNEEKGLLGSKAYFRAHKDRMQSVPVINLDCVGNGEHFVVIEKQPFESHPLRDSFHEHLSPLPDIRFVSAKKAQFNSDQRSFPLGVGIGACKMNRHGVLYTDRIHTRRDTEASSGNTAALAEALCGFLRSAGAE